MRSTTQRLRGLGACPGDVCEKLASPKATSSCDLGQPALATSSLMAASSTFLRITYASNAAFFQERPHLTRTTSSSRGSMCARYSRTVPCLPCLSDGVAASSSVKPARLSSPSLCCLCLVRLARLQYSLLPRAPQ